MKKKIICTMLAAMMVMSVTACSTEKDVESSADTVVTEDSSATEGETTETETVEVPMKEIDADGNVIFKIGDATDTVTLGEYKNVYPVEESVLTPTETEIQDALDYYRGIYATDYTHVDKATEQGDNINVTYVASLNGEEIFSETSTIVLGYDMINTGVDAELLDMVPGETRGLTTTFPEGFYDERIAGQSTALMVTLNWIGGDKVLSEYTDEFVTEMTSGMYTTTAEFDEVLLNEISQNKIQEVFTSAWGIIVENATVADMSDIVTSEFDARMADIAETIEVSGITQEDYWNMYGGVTSQEEFETIIRDEVERDVKERAVVYKLAEENGITVSEDELNEGLATSAANAGLSSAEEFLAVYGNDYVADSLLYSKVLDFVVENQITK